MLAKSSSPPKIVIKGETSDYRNCDNFWSFVIPKAIIKYDGEEMVAGNCKIIAFESEQYHLANSKSRRQCKSFKSESKKKKKLN